ncbi:MAG: 50S ribosomal protein L10 [Acutalibacteraceae bacterium]|nr:50S ribosomal protein L10 [Acutalibacteraceae bacterium]
MPSAAILEQKKQIVADVAEKIKGAVAGVIVDYRGITVEEDTKLRKELREAGVDYFVIKNTLLGRAADEAGLSDIKSVLEGTTAIALSNEDHIAAARILNTFAEGKDYFEIKSGFIDGEVITVEKVKYLAKLPTKEGLIAKALGSLKAPISNLVYALNAIKDKKSEEEAA